MKAHCEFNGLGKKSKPVAEVHKLFSSVSSVSTWRGEGGRGGSLTTGFKGRLLLCRLRASSELPKGPSSQGAHVGRHGCQWAGPAQERSRRFAWSHLPMVSREPWAVLTPGRQQAFEREGSLKP